MFGIDGQKCEVENEALSVSDTTHCRCCKGSIPQKDMFVGGSKFGLISIHAGHAARKDMHILLQDE